MAKMIFFLLLSSLFAEVAPAPPAPPFKRLALYGIDLSIQLPAESKKGPLTLSDFNRTGNIFRKWLELSPIKPSKIIWINKREPEKELP